MPIVQAPADQYITLTTVINHSVSIVRGIGQQYTIITVDQPLNSKYKELTWTNPASNDVIILLRRLHIIMNFLKARLDDLWTESGVYATNTTQTMLEGKAYYTAVTAHTLTYETLWHIE